MGNNTSNTIDQNLSTSNDDSKLNQDDCTHGYNDGEYTFIKSDQLLNVHHKNEYNDALSGDRAGSFNSVGVIQDVYTVHTEPKKIADACNDCEIKTFEQQPWKPTGTSDYAFDASYSNSYGTSDYSNSCGTSDYTRDSDSNRCSNMGSNSDSNSDRGSERWQHRPEWRD